ncbi:MAG: Stp1/IreP family PP2C-type Ser/Thr phosphatase [Selenomonadaceae bacterium]|nr:Stp1/IreP family PP2C-type Ser/Thr phosphatase [Selenomonadaceae bacterium]
MTRKFQATHVGRVRRNNEDSLIIIEPETFAVADGMGGASAGEVASQMLVETVKEFLAETPPIWDEKILSRAIVSANEKILNMARRNEEYRGMGTTATILHLNDKRAYFAHVGDSRIYRLRGNSFEQITEDHSYVETLVRRGELTHEAARVHPLKNVLTQAVGAMDELNIDAANLPVENGDIYLLCTDGLTNMVDDETVANILKTAHNPADALIDAALSAGGKDNVSVIVVGVD